MQDNIPANTLLKYYCSETSGEFGVFVCKNEISIDTLLSEELPYINGVGVLSYDINTKNKKVSEFYVPSTNIVEIRRREIFSIWMVI